MAVTQQLVRIKPTTLERCARDVRALGKLLCSHSWLTSEELNLDWAPYRLIRALRELDLSSIADVVQLATEGVQVVNVEHPAGPADNPVFEGEVKFLSPELVARVADELTAAHLVNFGRASETLQQLQSQGLLDPAPYLADALSNLSAFYHRAAEAEEVVVVWWD